MNIRLSIAALVMTTFLTGCGSIRFPFLGPGNKPETGPAPAVPTVEKLVEYLNDNSNRVSSLKGEYIDLECTQNGQTVGLMADMLVQKPRNFRMGARAAGSNEVDVGSNQDEFWWWVKRANPPYQYHVAHKDWSEGKVQGMAFPFQPEWIMEAMYLGNYGPPSRYKLESDNEQIRLVERIASPNGKAVRKVICFHRRPAAPPKPQITEFKLVDDASGRDICFARIVSTQEDPRTRAILPQRIELHCPDMKVKLAMRIDRPTTQLELQQASFTRPNLQGIPTWNLANGAPNPNLQQVQGRQ